MDKQPLFSRKISTGTRMYYVDVHFDRKGQQYITISEIPTGKAPGGKSRQRIFIHAENVEELAKAFSEAAAHIKNGSER